MRCAAAVAALTRCCPKWLPPPPTPQKKVGRSKNWVQRRTHGHSTRDIVEFGKKLLSRWDRKTCAVLCLTKCLEPMWITSLSSINFLEETSIAMRSKNLCCVWTNVWTTMGITSKNSVVPSLFNKLCFKFFHAFSDFLEGRRQDFLTGPRNWGCEWHILYHCRLLTSSLVYKFCLACHLVGTTSNRWKQGTLAAASPSKTLYTQAHGLYAAPFVCGAYLVHS